MDLNNINNLKVIASSANISSKLQEKLITLIVLEKSFAISLIMKKTYIQITIP